MVDLTKQISNIVEFWQKRGWGVDVQPTQAPNHAIDLARSAAINGSGLVMAGGGDGTIGEVVNGLVGTDAILVPLPMGTTNSFARELKMPMPRFQGRVRLDNILPSLANGRIQKVDVGYKESGGANGRYWLMWCGVGVDSFIVHQLEPRPAWSRRLGRVGYSLQGLANLSKFRPVHATVTVDDKTIEGEFLLIEINNCRLYAGLLPMNPHAKLDDGEYEIMLFKGSKVPQTFAYVSNLMMQWPRPPDKVITLKGKHVTITTNQPIACHTDGDQAGFTPLNAQLHARALRLLVPDTAPADLFEADGEPFT